MGGRGEITSLGEGLGVGAEWAQGIAWGDEDEQTGLVRTDSIAAWCSGFRV